MKKRYIFGALAAVIVIVFISNILFGTKEDTADKSNIPRIGQYMWTFNMNKGEWREYLKSDDLKSKEEVILQSGYAEGNGSYTVYLPVTGNQQILKDELWFGEGSQEFLQNKNLYSYYPKTFEFYQIAFNGVTFIPDHLTIDKISKLFRNYEIIKISDIKNNKNNIKYSKTKNKFIVLNDIGDNFYKYYIIPNDSKKMKIKDFSNQFEVSAPVDIKLQRLEGCSKAYPCYNIHITK